MFANCKNLTNVDLSGWDTPNVTDLYSMFHSCRNLTTIDLSGWDVSKVTTMQYMFGSCYNLTEIRMGGPIRSDLKVTSMFNYIDNTGTFYYPKEYDYTPIINALPPKWTAVAY
jgi:surface protein